MIVVVVKVVAVKVVVVKVIVVREDHRLVLKVRIFNWNLPLLRLNEILFCKSVVSVVMDLESTKNDGTVNV